ncbi:MAG: hypothetical protein ACRD4I_17855, partial [Candidatus Angelobacter sp.]
LRVADPDFRGDITDIGARYSLSKGNAAVKGIHAQLLGGEVTGNMDVRDVAGASEAKLHAAVRQISLDKLRPLTQSAQLKQVALAGSLNADADATWSGKLENLMARTNATIQANVASRNEANTNTIPVNGVIHGQYSAKRKQISIQQSYLRLPQSSLNLNGTVSSHSSLQIRFRSNNVHELEAVADVLDPALQKQKFELQGTASFTGDMRGSTSVPQLTGQLSAENLQVKGSHWRGFTANVKASPSLAALENGELQPSDGGRISFALSTALRHWSFDQHSQISIALNANHVNADDLTKFAGRPVPIAGMLSANISVKGSVSSPTGQGEIGLTRASVVGEPLQ